MKGRPALLALVALAVPGGSLAVLALYLVRKRKAQMLTDKLRAGLPLRVERWAPEIARAALATAPPEVGAERWAFTFAGIVDRESGGGVFLVPQSPAGLGDAGHGHGLGQVDDRQAPGDASDYERQLSDKRLAHIASGAWAEPGPHLLFCAREVLRGAYDQFADVADLDQRLAAAVAAYNAGVDNVRAQLDAGADVNAVTTKGAGGARDYSTDVLARADKWSAAAEA